MFFNYYFLVKLTHELHDFYRIELTRKRHVNVIWNEDLVKGATLAKTVNNTVDGPHLHMF